MRSGNPFSWKFVAPLYMGSTLNPINSSMIATALVPIATFMHISVAQTTILVTVLYLASSITQPTAGKLSAEFGPRRIFLAGILMVLMGGRVGRVWTRLDHVGRVTSSHRRWNLNCLSICYAPYSSTCRIIRDVEAAWKCAGCASNCRSGDGRCRTPNWWRTRGCVGMANNLSR